tara:strand:+ start:340 stop:597 length:258 start_codon:yes stop_codon:yes gene_type:complete
MNRDNINPNHYKQGKVECIDAIESSMTSDQFKGYLKGNMLKYMWRYENKGGVEDLKKAQWYLNRLIESIGAQTELKEDQKTFSLL